MPTIPLPINPPLYTAVENVAAPATNEERSLLYLLRFVDHIISPGTLSPVERAYLAGAKVMFDQLSTECEKMLNRTVADLVGPPPEPMKVPLASREPVVAASENANATPDTPQTSLTGVQSTDAAVSLTSRLAKVEALLDKLTQVIGQHSGPNLG